MKYKFMDGAIFEANSFDELAHKLWKSKFIPEENIEEWMTAFAGRALIYDGSVLRTGSISEHIEDMFLCGFIKEIE